MVYPSSEDFIIGVQNLDKMVFDPVLRGGKIKSTPTGPTRYSGGFSLVFPIETDTGKYALRCWIANIGESEKRYKSISAHINKVQLPYFVDFQYILNGILAKGKRWPIIRMNWVEGTDLKSYIKSVLKAPDKLEELASSFRNMVATLHDNHIAHGDLQHRNIMVQKGGRLILIDYDSMYVPELTGFPDTIKGYPAYQHPARKQNTDLGTYLDYFSELVLFISIKALGEDPSLWTRHKIEKRDNELLFSEQDFLNPYSSALFDEIEQISYPLKRLVSFLRKACMSKDISTLLPLEAYLRQIEPKIIIFSTQKRGKQTILKWNVAYADSVRLDGITVPVSGEKDISGLDATTIYKLTAYNKKFSSKRAKASLTVKVAKIHSFTSSDLAVYDGMKIVLFWKVEDAHIVELIGVSQNKVPAWGRKEVSAMKSHPSFRIIAYDDIGSISESIDLMFLDVPKIENIPIAKISLPRQISIQLPQATPINYTASRFPQEAFKSIQNRSFEIRPLFQRSFQVEKRNLSMSANMYNLIIQVWSELKQLLHQSKSDKGK